MDVGKTSRSMASSPRAPLVVLALSRIAKIVPLLLLVAAILVVRHLLNQYTYDEVMEDLSKLSTWQILAAIILSCLNYFILTLYDYLGTRYVRAQVPLRKLAVVSFIAYAFSQNLGASILSGGAVRYRFYQREGLSGTAIAKIVGFAFFHFWLGLLCLTGILSMIMPEAFSQVFGASEGMCRLIGAAILFPTAVYCLFLAFPKLLARRYRRVLPRRWVAISGLLVCVTDWILAAAVFYMTLFGEHDITLAMTVAAFLGAQVIGVASHVPGGLGVFEATVAYLLSPHHDNSELLSSLIAFRVIYYFIPFILSVFLLTASEVSAHLQNLRGNPVLVSGYEFLGNILVASSPMLSSIMCGVAGFFLILEGSFPPPHHLPVYFGHTVPLHTFEALHFAAALLGVVLIFISSGLRRAIRDTCHVSIALLTLSSLTALGIGAETESLLFAIITWFLWYNRSSFYRTGRFVDSLSRTPWVWTIGMVSIAIVFGSFTFQEFEYSGDVWLQMDISAGFPRFLRGVLAMFLGLLGCGIYRGISRPKEYEHHFPSSEELTNARTVMQTSSSTMGFLALAGDKELLFSDARDAFLMWRQSGSSFICLSDPQGAPEKFPELIWKFRELAEDNSKLCAFYEISPVMIPHIMDLGFRIFKIGEEGLVNLRAFTDLRPKMRSIRGVFNRMTRAGISFRIMERDEVIARMGELKEVSDEWLIHKTTSEKGFSLGFFDPTYLSNFRCAVIESDTRILGFANIFESSAKNELSIDLMRDRAEVPNGVMDYLFVNLFEWGAAQGYQTFSLGMAPLSGLSDNPLAPDYARLGNLVYRHGGHFYNFEGLRKYKDKFEPVWQPRYLACPSRLSLPIVLSNISTLIAGGFKGLVQK